jgi:hypothetical protein
MTNRPFNIQDEFHSNFSAEEILRLGRLRMQNTFSSGHAIGERFDDRYDTEVGGNQLVVSQDFDSQGNLSSGLRANMTLEELGKHPKQQCPSAIVDFQMGRRYSAEEANSLPELAGPLRRLKEREESLRESEPGNTK